MAEIESYGSAHSELRRFEVRAMGTRNVLLVSGLPERELREAAQEAFETIERLEGALSKFLPSSDLSHLNLLGASQPVRVGKDLLFLLLRAREAWEATGGAFDPAVGPLLEAWGFVGLEGRVPAPREVETARSLAGMVNVEVDPASGTASLARPGVSLDLGGIAKGYAVDVAADCLAARGVAVGAVLSGRSSARVWGRPPGEEAWRFDLVHPSDPEGSLRTVLVETGAVSASSASERKFVRGGRTYGHVIDPRTGAPARGVLSAAVWTESALIGDVLSTALLVLGREGLEEGGAAERLLERWKRPGSEARASVVLAVENPRLWGGFEVVERHFGKPGFREVRPEG
ncbi:MAG: FAD:protein FMN transferase [Planctomycetota bacterium]